MGVCWWWLAARVPPEPEKDDKFRNYKVELTGDLV